MADAGVELVLGSLADRAGIKNYDVSGCFIMSHLITIARQIRRNSLRVRHIHLAAECFEIYFLHLLWRASLGRLFLGRETSFTFAYTPIIVSYKVLSN